MSQRLEPIITFQDAHGRSIAYLRLSLTEACSMRCSYCRPAFHGQPHDKSVLAVNEIDQLVRHLASQHGLKKVRLTGGEPTTRSDLTAIIRHLAAVPELGDLAMTTNGLTLARHAHEYANAGLRRINVSLDGLHAERFAELTGVDGLDQVLAGLDAAETAGLCPIRLNTVVVRGQNEQDLPSLVRFAARRGWDIRFIELMPMGPLAAQWAQRYVPEAEMRQRLDPIVQTWTPIKQQHDAARRYALTLDAGSSATVGFITPMSCNFCAACNRIRIASDATLYPCLMDRPGPSLLRALRPKFDPDVFDQLLIQGLSAKKPKHPAQGHTMMIQLGG